MNMSCRSNRWHVCPLSLRVLHHEAPNSRRRPNGHVGRGLPRAISRNLELDETREVPSQTDLNQAEGGRECHFERFMQAA